MVIKKNVPRLLTVGSQYRRSEYTQRTVPFIRLAGVWLEDAGFNEGDRIVVYKENNGLRIIHNPLYPNKKEE